MNITLININKYQGEDYIYIGRPSLYGNPFSSKENTLAEYKTDNRTESINRSEKYFRDNPHIIDSLIHELSESNINKLGCFCHPKPCHGDILIKLINERKYKSIF